MQGIVQVAIGMIFIFSLLSILVTTINSVITSILQWRAKNLKYAIESLITDPEVQAQFLSHPLIKMVKAEMVKPHEVATAQDAETMAEKVRNTTVNTVNQIDPKIFAQVLNSILAEKSSIQLYAPLQEAIATLPDSPAKQRLLALNIGTVISTAKLADIQAAVQAVPVESQGPLLWALKPIEDRMSAQQVTEESGSQLLTVLDGLQRINEDAFRRALKVIVGSAQTIDQAQTNVEDWFNQRMSQLSEVYKRNLTYLTLGIGLILVVVLNADSLQMARALWEDPTIRDAAVVFAQNAAANNTTTTDSTGTSQGATNGETQDVGELLAQIAPTLNQFASLNLPIGWEYTPITTCVTDNSGASATPDPNATAAATVGADATANADATAESTAAPGGSGTSETVSEPECDVAACESNGTSDADSAPPCKVVSACDGSSTQPIACQSQRNIWNLIPGNTSDWFTSLIRKAIGFAVTVIAIGQGAPFWFDLIRRLVNPAK